VVRAKVPPEDAVDLIIKQWHAQRPALDVSAMEVLGRLHRGYLKYQALLNTVFDRYGINNGTFDVLAALRRSGPPYRMTAGELATSSLVTTGGITLRIDRLEEAGMVERIRLRDDRRVVYAQLTADGLKLVDEVSQVHFENERVMLDGLTATDQKQLAGLLRKLERSIAAAADRSL
jgi:DNA-binding MarR family transcriptional regulator